MSAAAGASASPTPRGVVDVTLDDDELVVRPRGWWAMLSLRRRLRIPRSALVSAHVAADPTTEVPVSIRVGGTGTLSVRAGYMRGEGQRSWWCYRYGRSAVVVALSLPKLQHVVIMTDDDGALVRSIDESTRPRIGSR